VSSASGDEGLVRFSAADVDGFAEASHDVNPLHVSEVYARSTPFGRRVVHGMLAALACLGRLPARPGERLARLLVEFKSPLFADVSYRVEGSDEGARSTVRICDGRRVALRLVADFVAGSVASAGVRPAAPRSEPARLDLEDLREGWERHGSYGPAAGGVESIAARLGTRPGSGIGAGDAAVLMASSYLVGMEAPGEAALFSRATIHFDAQPAAGGAALSYRLGVIDRDARFDLVRMTASFMADGAPFARADLEAFVRAGPAVLDSARLRALSPPAAALAGKTAIVVGASRGLGAAIALALADQGCSVGSSFARSAAAAARVAALAGPGRITLLQADAEDTAAFTPAARGFAEARGGLDVLVCNACPPLSALSLDAASLPRILEYVARSVAMVAVPLAATLDLLAARAGTLVVVSSAAVEDPPRHWPHYITAKAAIEGLARAMLADAPALRAVIVRPPRLWTDLVSTPGSRHHAIAPEIVAARLAGLLARGVEPGLSVLDGFVDGAA
jgi:NAD(P)-dependent dehydrogenase (short-subunit alcohol dehydrogenase family)/acyl dehydratase